MLQPPLSCFCSIKSLTLLAAGLGLMVVTPVCTFRDTCLSVQLQKLTSSYLPESSGSSF